MNINIIGKITGRTITTIELRPDETGRVIEVFHDTPPGYCLSVVRSGRILEIDSGPYTMEVASRFVDFFKASEPKKVKKKQPKARESTIAPWAVQ